jgi:hypothetical protein
MAGRTEAVNRSGTTARESLGLGRSLRARREASLRLPPIPDGRRDVLDPKPRHIDSARSRSFVTVRVRGSVALLRGWEAAGLADACSVPRRWSKAGRGWVIDARHVPDVMACAESWKVIVRLVEEEAA